MPETNHRVPTSPSQTYLPTATISRPWKDIAPKPFCKECILDSSSASQHFSGQKLWTLGEFHELDLVRAWFQSPPHKAGFSGNTRRALDFKDFSSVHRLGIIFFPLRIIAEITASNGFEFWAPLIPYPFKGFWILKITCQEISILLLLLFGSWFCSDTGDTTLDWV